MAHTPIDLIIHNIGQLATAAGHSQSPATGRDLCEAGLITGGAIAVADGRIVAVGSSSEILAMADEKTTRIDAEGRLATPGFVDPHTHLIYAGSREHEWALKQQGVPYLEILKRGGGILYSVEQTRRAGAERLLAASRQRIDTMLAHGTTTVEAKSGYGLDTETELLQLKLIKELDQIHPVDLVATFMGAHAHPKEFKGREDAFVRLIIDEMLPAVKRQGIAKFNDVFCEKGVFDPDSSRAILQAGMKLGLRPKVHADELAVSGGSHLAAELKAISADHLLETDEAGMEALATAGVVGVLLPATSFNLANGHYARARRMVEKGMALALATDCNPGSSPTENMQLVLTLACLYLKLTPAEALVASTINAAHAIGMNEQVGSIEVGKQADIVIMDAPNLEYLPYHFGVNHVWKVIKKGHVAYATSH
ncbi:MAG: imidazolonepropionase [Bacillota bacterium]